MATRKRCWTCKGRKVACDGAIPTCLACSKSNRQCGGYDLRLSWPRQTDRKRALIGVQPPEHERDTIQHRELPWINASCKDLSLYNVGSSLGGVAFGHWSKDGLAITSCISESLAWTPDTIKGSDKELLRYFETVISNILPMFDSDRTRIRQLLMQMALSDDTPSSQAVLDSILAVASLHRNGDNVAATRLKLSALHALIASSRKGVSQNSGLQHIACGILLCHFELHQSSENSSAWVGHLCGAKDVIKAVQSAHYAPGSDSFVMMGWVYYHDVLARFSIRHWRTDMLKHTTHGLGFDFEGAPHVCILQYGIARASFTEKIPNIAQCSHQVVRLLSEVCDTILYPWTPEYHAKEYRDRLHGLESRLSESLSPADSDTDMSSQPGNDGFDQVLELFRLATLVYLERTARNFSGQSAKLDRWTDEAFSIFAELETCAYPLPLFIFGCEARSEDRRVVISELFARTERGPHFRNLQEVMALVQSAWIQEDLEVDGELEYIRKLNLVISSRDIIPSFA